MEMLSLKLLKTKADLLHVTFSQLSKKWQVVPQTGVSIPPKPTSTNFINFPSDSENLQFFSLLTFLLLNVLDGQWMPCLHLCQCMHCADVHVCNCMYHDPNTGITFLFTWMFWSHSVFKFLLGKLLLLILFKTFPLFVLHIWWILKLTYLWVYLLLKSAEDAFVSALNLWF